MTEIEKILDGITSINDYSLENDFDNDEITVLLENDIIRATDISQWRASDLLIDGIIDYDQYPFDNFAVCEQLRQLEHGAISLENFMEQADFEIFDDEEIAWFKEIKEMKNGD